MNHDEINPEEVKKNLARAIDHLDKGETDEAEECLLRHRDVLQSMIDNLQRLFNLQEDHPPTQESETPRDETAGQKEPPKQQRSD